MKHSHRRQMVGNLAALLAAPLALSRLSFDIFGGFGEHRKVDGKPALDRNQTTIRPRIAAPKGSVMRRG